VVYFTKAFAKKEPQEKPMRLLSFAAAFALFATALHASLVPVTNPSFESATLPFNTGNGPFSQVVPGSSIFSTGGTVDGWSVFTNSDASAATGAFDPNLSGTNWTSKWWDGNNVAYVQTNQQGNNVDLFQILGPLANNTTYTLTVDVGRRGFTPVFNYAIGLGPDTPPPSLALANSLHLAPNSFGTDSVSFTTGPNAASTGKHLEIVLATVGGDGFTEAFFDNVRVDATPAVPEPRMAGLVLASCLGAGIRRAVLAICGKTRV
jgi:hypothetical protein